MPHKFNAGRRDKFPKAKYTVTNWSDYNKALRRRDDLACGWGRREMACAEAKGSRWSAKIFGLRD